ncbi:MAG: RsmB/NOP family class I SAM-dependent RNA methyltransferase [Methanothrix sp.]|nr:RsmB/NOP family class I SAM-dependent RNA methyltransferase [Methanothrix sp.]
MDYLDRYREIVPDYPAFRDIQSLPLYNSARINTLKIEPEKLLERLQEEGVVFRRFDWYPLGLKLDAESPGKLLENLLGQIHIQEELSMVPPLVLDPQPGECILDMCASPGSKTTQIAQMMENKGLVIANEPSLGRIAPLRSNCERLGVLNVAVTRYDGRRFPRGSFDRVLVDAPCSSEGRERRGPGTLARCSRERSLGLKALQVGLLKSALRLVRPGGVVVYSTCTYAPEENELVVQEALGWRSEGEDGEHGGLCGDGGGDGGSGRHSGDNVDSGAFRLEKVKIAGLKECPGIVEWEGKRLMEELSATARYYPHINDTGGFYVARIIKS